MTNNTKNLNNKLMEELCNRFKIKHSKSTPCHHKMNGPVEEVNKNIIRVMKKMTVTYQYWHEMLQFALHDYQMLVHTSTKAAPLSQV